MDCHDSVAPFNRKTHQEVKQWFVKLQEKKGDCLSRGFIFELPKRGLSKDSSNQENSGTENHLG